MPLQPLLERDTTRKPIAISCQYRSSQATALPALLTRKACLLSEVCINRLGQPLSRNVWTKRPRPQLIAEPASLQTMAGNAVSASQAVTSRAQTEHGLPGDMPTLMHLIEWARDLKCLVCRQCQATSGSRVIAKAILGLFQAASRTQ